MLRKAIVLGLAVASLSSYSTPTHAQDYMQQRDAIINQGYQNMYNMIENQRARRQLEQQGTTASAQTPEQVANQICAQTIAAYHEKSPLNPVAGQVIANNLLTWAADNLERINVPNTLVSAIRERVAIGGDYAVAMDRGAAEETLALSQYLDENGARIQNAATRLSLDQCARLGGL